MNMKMKRRTDKGIISKGVIRLVMLVALATLISLGADRKDVSAATKTQAEKLTSQGKTVTVNVPSDWYNDWYFTLGTVDGKRAICLYNYKENPRSWNAVIPSKAIINNRVYYTVLNNDAIFSGKCNDMTKTIKILDSVKVKDIEGLGILNGLDKCESIIIGKLDVPETVEINDLFRECRAKRLDASGLDLSNRKSYENLFYRCYVDHLDVSYWKNTSCTSMYRMFHLFCGETINFKGFNTSNVKNMREMFNNAMVNSLDLSGFDVSNVTDMTGMFYNILNVETISVKDWKANNVKTLEGVFIKGTNPKPTLKKVILGNFEAKKCTSTYRMFYDVKSLETIEVSKMDLRNTTNFKEMFFRCNIKSIDLSVINMPNAKYFERMFQACPSLKTVNMANCDLRKLESMFLMFYQCTSLTSVNFGKSMDLSNLTSMSSMFEECTSLKEMDLSALKTPKLISMGSLFENCKSLTKVNLEGMDTSKVKCVIAMFRYCDSLEVIDLSSLDFSSACDKNLGFANDTVKVIYTPKKLGDVLMIYAGNKWDLHSLSTVNGKRTHKVVDYELDYISDEQGAGMVLIQSPENHIWTDDAKHAWTDDWKVCSPATCKSFEKSSKTCLICGEKKYITSGNTYGPHNYVTKKVAPTYKKKGYTLHKCTICKKEYKTNYVAVKVRPTKIKALRNKSGKVYLKWSKVSGAYKYKIEYSTSKSFSKKATKSLSVSGKSGSCYINKLKKNKVYYFRIKTIKREKTKKGYVYRSSTWSPKRKIKTPKR